MPLAFEFDGHGFWVGGVGDAVAGPCRSEPCQSLWRPTGAGTLIVNLGGGPTSSGDLAFDANGVLSVPSTRPNGE